MPKSKAKKKEIIDIKMPSSLRIPGVPLEIDWCVKEGDHVAPGDKIACLHSSKYDTTYEIEGEGIVLSSYFGEMRQCIDIEISPSTPAGTIVKLCDRSNRDSESEDAEDSDGEYVEKSDVEPGDIICQIQPDDDTNTPKTKKKKK